MKNININWNNTAPTLPALVDLTTGKEVGRQAGRQIIGRIQKF